jgi:perosamine synthetase
VIPLARPLLGPEETAAVDGVLRSGMLVQGPRVSEFEELVAKRCCRAHAVALSSGTAALQLALDALGIGPGDRVLCPDLSWPSPAHAILDRGAEPLLADIDRREWNVTPETLLAAKTGDTGAAIVIDQFGNPARTREIAEAMPDVNLIVDAACSLGSTMDNGATPCGALGVISCFSFHPRKLVTTGEGGMCLTDDDELAFRIRSLRNHGQDAPGSFLRASGNFRMTDIAAAIGTVQMSRLTGMVEARRELARRYREALSHLALQECAPGAHSNYQTFGLLLPEGTTAGKRDAVVAGLRERGVGSGLLSYALHRQTSLSDAARAAEAAGRALSVSSAVADRGLALPLFPGLGEAEQERIIDTLSDVIS